MKVSFLIFSVDSVTKFWDSINTLFRKRTCWYDFDPFLQWLGWTHEFHNFAIFILKYFIQFLQFRKRNVLSCGGSGQTF